MNSVHIRRTVWIALGSIAMAGLVIAAGSAGIPFSHPKHLEAGADCSVCHPDAAASKSGGDHLLPGTQACLGCHEEKDLKGWGWAPAEAADSRFPGFSHESHLALVEEGCVLCHGALGDPKLAAQGSGEIGHGLCFDCHDGRTRSAECADCHADAGALRPLDHGPEYRHTHQFAARGSSGDCEQCHRQSEQCSECHQGENVLFLTHDRNYRFTHPLDARKHENDCASCHEPESFCNDCHLREGVAPENHAQDWITGSNRHAPEARRDIASCAGCHSQDEPLCVGCHRDATPGRGNDASIHPGGFDGYGVEGPWHEDDAYYCFDCHARATGTNRFCQYCHGSKS